MTDFETAKQYFLQGLQLVEANDLSSAQAMFTRSLEIVPERVSTLNNLSAIKNKLGKFSEAEEFARKAIALEGNSPEAWSNLGLALAGADRHEEALNACERALQLNSAHAMAWLAKTVTMRALKRHSDALAACDEALKFNPSKDEILYIKSLILKDLGQADEAQELYEQALLMRAAASPLHIGERRATQKAEALVVTGSPARNNSFTPLNQLGRLCPNFAGQFGYHLQEHFHFNYLFSVNEIRPPAQVNIPKPDFIINNHVNGELLVTDGNSIELIEFLESFGVPIVNHPAKAVKTARDVSAELLSDIPGVIVPKTMRFSSIGKTRQALAREIEHQFTFPLIARTLASQQGIGMFKIDSREALVARLSAGCPDEFFVTQFVETRETNPFYRKIRAAVVGDEIVFIRVDYDTHWNVHGRKKPERWTFYFDNPHLLEEEKRICNHPEAELGRPALEALRAIRMQIPMDVFGIDFEVDQHGRVVFYEANATMNLFSTAPKELANPPEAADRLKDAFQRFFTSVIRGQSPLTAQPQHPQNLKPHVGIKYEL